MVTLSASEKVRPAMVFSDLKRTQVVMARIDSKLDLW